MDQSLYPQVGFFFLAMSQTQETKITPMKSCVTGEPIRVGVYPPVRFRGNTLDDKTKGCLTFEECARYLLDTYEKQPDILQLCIERLNEKAGYPVSPAPKWDDYVKGNPGAPMYELKSRYYQGQTVGKDECMLFHQKKQQQDLPRKYLMKWKDEAGEDQNTKLPLKEIFQQCKVNPDNIIVKLERVQNDHYLMAFEGFPGVVCIP